MASGRVGAEPRTVHVVPVGDDHLVEIGGQRNRLRMSKTPTRAGRVLIRRTAFLRWQGFLREIANSNGADIRVRILVLR
jgi:hypothetical protein